MKDTSYFAYLFRVQNGGSLTLKNIILDGDKDNHPMDNQNNRSLIFVTGGTLVLMCGKEASNRKQEIDRQHHMIPNQREPKRKRQAPWKCV